MIIGKKLVKIILKALLIITAFYALFYIFILSSCSKTRETDNIDEFDVVINDVYGASNHIPDLEKLGHYETIVLHNKKTDYILWGINTLSINLEYTEQNYEEAIERINSSVSFVDEKKEGLYDYSAVVNGYAIKIVDKLERFDNDYAYDYPKCFMMIGNNKENHSIVYLYHYDMDLDEIKDLDDFIKKYYELG